MRLARAQALRAMPPTRRTERSSGFGSAAALHLIHGLVASTRALSMRVTLRTRSPRHPQVPRSKPPTFNAMVNAVAYHCQHEREPHAYTCDAITLATLLDARLFGSGCIPRRAYAHAERNQRKPRLACASECGVLGAGKPFQL